MSARDIPPYDVIARLYKKMPHTMQKEMYLCSFCDKTFSTKGSVKKHQESTHHQSAGFSSMQPTLLHKRPPKETHEKYQCTVPAAPSVEEAEAMHDLHSDS